MKQMFNFTTSMTHPFLKYAENAHLTNRKVIQLIDDLRNGLSEEDAIQSQKEPYRLSAQKQKNIMTCYCIMLYIQCLAYFSDEHERYDRFINNWKGIIPHPSCHYGSGWATCRNNP